MRFNPFGHIKTENFKHHSLAQRFSDTLTVFGTNPFKIYELVKGSLALIKRARTPFIPELSAEEQRLDAAALQALIEQKVNAHQAVLKADANDFAEKAWNETSVGLLSYAMMIPALATIIATILGIIPGGLLIWAASKMEAEIPSFALAVIGAILALPVALAAILTGVAFIAAQFIIGAALTVAVSPFVLLTHLGCQIAKCFSPEPEAGLEDENLLDGTNPTHSVVGAALGHDTTTAVKLKAVDETVSAKKLVDESSEKTGAELEALLAAADAEYAGENKPSSKKSR